ncbi:MAG: hypothetical protein ABJE66_12120 [Deltaproteobacteria bacterium]
MSVAARSGDALAVVAHRLGADRDRVLARIGGELGVQARAAATAIGKLDAGAQKLERARVMATSRVLWPAGLRAIHPTWIEAALADLPPRARTAVANGQGDALDTWLGRWALADFAAMPAIHTDIVRVPADLPALSPEALRGWLERAGADQLARALQLGGGTSEEPWFVAAAARIAVPPRLGQLGGDRAIVQRCSKLPDDDVRLAKIGARTVAPHLDAGVERQLVQRLPRALGLVVRTELRAFARDLDHQNGRASWPALA